MEERNLRKIRTGIPPSRLTKSEMNDRQQNSEPVTYETVRQIALTLPGAEEGTSYGTPACKVKGKLFARLHQDDDDQEDADNHFNGYHETEHDLIPSKVSNMIRK